ncbi:MAG: hypothetical protein RLZZ26_476 [Candidatus Parcubacteria bacterium]|jgi:hypothetical protein
MGPIIRHWRIILAGLFSAGLIVSAFVFVQGVESPRPAQASTESALLKAITVRDSNGDGLPDWQKTLYGIPLNATTTDYFNLGMTDGEAVAKGLIVPKAIADIPAATSSPQTFDANGLPPPAPDGTLSAAFSQKFSSLYIAAKQANNGAELSDADISNIVNQAMGSLSSAVAPAPSFKSGSQIKIAGSGPAALKAFAASAEAVMSANRTTATKDPVWYLTQALQDNDASALDKLASAAKSTRDVAAGIAGIAVPVEAASAALELVNTQMKLSEIMSDFSHEDADPMTALMALQQYLGAVEAFGTAFLQMDNVFKKAGVTFAPGDPGEKFANYMAHVVAAQQAAAAIAPATTP